MRVAVLGLGEAGRRYSADLVAAGASVSAFDVRSVDAPEGVHLADSIVDAVGGASLVLSLTAAAGGLDAVKAACHHLSPGAVYADLNAASPAFKAEAAAALIDGGLFADVAVLAPVAREGLRTPVLVAGPGAEAFAALLHPYDPRIEIVPGPPGAAASRKLLRSVFMKSLAAAILESLAAAHEAGCEEWARAQIVGELGPQGAQLVERMVTGTYQHAERRLHEMEDALSYLEELGTPTHMTAAAISWLASLSAGQGR